ncbi:hypothetical protein [Mucilaginibacter segetis]|uniref:Holin n=1 Tax=Mucilaginibacter segetis TaxID=2793071 RepID=A0A934UM24_9SPHI|nr:hypothetical protein [Mucilaginibacter segetis]MBK0378580.1 hypothetical protein [Mucilaginibacter segetis]
MEKKFTLIQRFLSDTPSFFKRAQIFGVGLAGMGTSLAQIAVIPANLCTILIATGTTIAIIAQFAVKQYEPLTPPHNDEDK